jgi:hypothetical protein
MGYILSKSGFEKANSIFFSHNIWNVFHESWTHSNLGTQFDIKCPWNVGVDENILYTMPNWNLYNVYKIHSII